VEVDDVQHLTAQALEGDIFGLVDALGSRNGKVASTMLHRLLEEEDPLRIFGMIVRQFRLILLAREILDYGGLEDEVAGRLKIHPYVAKKVTAQARGFSRIALEEVYHHLLEVDEAIKTGRVDADLGLDVFIAQHA
jgi:DNA polymerase-3 subunit delta